MQTLSRFPLAAASIVMMGCAGLFNTFTAAEVGRVPLTAPGTASTTAVVAAGPVALWTDLDVSWDGDAALAYDVQVSQDGAVIAQLRCDPLDVNVTMNSMTSDFGGSHSRRYQGLMHCDVTAPVDGMIEVTASLSVLSGAPTLELADLVLKQ